MTREDKELLMKDLSARLSYGVKVEAKGLLKTIADDYDDRNIINAHVLNGLNLRDYFKTYSIDSMEKVPLFNRKGVCNIKPYLFPLSSMTDEQKEYINNRWGINDEYDFEIDPNWGRPYVSYTDASDYVDWLDKNKFDHRGLIYKGLAIDATNKNVY